MKAYIASSLVQLIIGMYFSNSLSGCELGYLGSICDKWRQTASHAECGQVVHPRKPTALLDARRRHECAAENDQQNQVMGDVGLCITVRQYPGELPTQQVEQCRGGNGDHQHPDPERSACFPGRGISALPW